MFGQIRKEHNLTWKLTRQGSGEGSFFCPLLSNKVQVLLLCLLGYRDIFDCLKYNKAILEEDKISESAKGKVFAVTLAALDAFAMC